MKPIDLIRMGVLVLILGVAAPTYARQEREQGGKPAKQEEQKKQQPQDKGQQHQQKQQPQARSQQQPHKQQPQADVQQRQKPTPRPQEQRGGPAEHRSVWQGHRANSWQSEHRSWQQRGGYNGYRIPDERFHSYFGPSHAFRIYSNPVIVVGGYPRFQYGGFWFSIVDPWPEYWSDGWYENDDVYVDYFGDGYYLYNRRYPRDRIAITVYLN